MQENPLVSIVTPSFNQGPFIEDTIRSIKEQAYPKIEHIIVDGGSTDETLDIVRRYERSYEMQWVSEEDDGPADACNRGFERANGDILCYLNSDDVFLPDAISMVVQQFESDELPDLVTGNGYVTDGRGRRLRKVFAPRMIRPKLYVMEGIDILQPSTFWTRKIFDRVGGFNGQNGTCWDAEFWVDCMLAGARWGRVDEPLAEFRIHEHSISGSGRLSEQYKNDHRRLFRKVTGRDPSVSDRFLLRPAFRVIGKLQRPANLIEAFRYRWTRPSSVAE